MSNPIDHVAQSLKQKNSSDAVAISNDVSASTLDHTYSTISSSTPSEIAPVVKEVALEHPTILKDWLKSESVDFRFFFIQKIVEILFPTMDLSSVQQNEKVVDAITYARKIEGESYKDADSKDNYLWLVSAKAFKVKKELEEKNKKSEEMGT